MSLNPFDQLDVVAIAAIAAIWVATFAVLRHVLLVPLLDSMARRQRMLEAAAAVDADARALVERAQQEAAAIAAAATLAAEQLDKQVKDELMQERTQKLADADQQAHAIAARGRDEVARLQDAETAKLEAQLLACTRQALQKVTTAIDETALRAVVAGALAGGRR